MNPRLTLSPGSSAWSAMLRDAPPASARRFREQLALPTDRAIVMSGHQAGLWHPGIVAKLLAIEALGESAHPVWICVDQDDNDPTLLEVPALGADGRLSRVRWVMGQGAMVPRGTPTGSRPPISPERFVGRTHPRVRADAIERATSALDRARGSGTLARQVQHAASELLRPIAPGHATIFATDLARTDLFGQLVERMGSDPAACVRAYNHAVAAHPRAMMRTLTLRDDGAIELPLWRVRDGEARLPVFAGQLASIPREQLAPRALLMTAIVRMEGCELFIHGTGGGLYDPVAEDWIRAWLLREIAPMGVVSATLRLPLAGEDLPDEREIQRRVALAHRARHDPAILGDHRSAREKHDLVRTIGAMRAAGKSPAREFRALHDLLARVRDERSGELARLEHDARTLAGRRDEARLAHDRTWSFIFHDDSALDGLARDVNRAIHARPGAHSTAQPGGGSR